jgi:hypothetical protein
MLKQLTELHERKTSMCGATSSGNKGLCPNNVSFFDFAIGAYANGFHHVCEIENHY